MKIIAVLIAVILGVLFVVHWAAERSYRYHDKVYNECIADGKAPYYCDTIAWQAVRARYD